MTASADRSCVALLESLGTAIAFFDAAGGLVYANNAWSLLTGSNLDVSRGGGIAQVLSALGPLSEGERLAQLLERVAEGKARTARLDVTCIDLQVQASQRVLDFVLSRLPPGNPFGAAASVVVNDVTEARYAASRLSRAEARVMAVAEAVGSGLLLLSEHDEVLFANAAACEALGVADAVSSLPGLSLAEVAERATRLSGAERNRLARLAAGATLANDKLTVRRTTINSEDGDAGGVVLVVGHAPAAATPAQVGERESQLVRTQLIETIGQELAVVLEGATAASIRAEQMELDPSVVEYLERIRGAAEASLTGIGSLVEARAPSERHSQAKSVPFLLRGFVADLVRQVVISAEQHGVPLKVKVEQDVAEHVEGDADRLRLALRTLIECALTSPRAGEVLLHIEPEYFSETAMTASVSVVTKPKPGTVLDAASMKSMRLAVAQFALHALKSELRVETGAAGAVIYRFTLSLPVQLELPARARPTFLTLTGMAVLIVSSNAKHRLQLANWLKAARMLPLEADNAAMALALLVRLAEEGNPVPLVILENQLPVQDGFLLAFRIKHDPRLAETLVVMLASQGRPGDAVACRENGIAAYLPHPVSRPRLVEAVTAVTGAAEEVGRSDNGATATLVTRHSLREERKGPTVLLVENESEEQVRIENALRRADATLLTATTRDEALSQVAQDVFDIVLVSLDLPDVERRTLIEELRQRMLRDAEATPMFALSRSYSLALDNDCKSWGYSGIMMKPVERDELITLALKISRQGTRKRAGDTAVERPGD
jgi:CheY-like chemotaxis protein